LNAATFHPSGDLWVSALSMGVVIVHPGGIVGVSDSFAQASATLVASPNPFRTETTLNVDLSAGTGEESLGIYGASGRLIRRLAFGNEGGRTALLWDGRDDQHRPVAPGVYFVRFQSRRAALAQRIVRLE
jgi:hypothetical protein